MKRGTSPYRLTTGVAALVLLLVALAAISRVFKLETDVQMALGYFLLTFGMFTTFLHVWTMSLSGTNDEKGKGRKALGGLFGHFVISLTILLVYFIFLFNGTLFEVWTALITYVISFIAFVILITGMR